MAAGTQPPTGGNPRWSTTAMALGISKAAYLLEFPGVHTEPLQPRPSQSQPWPHQPSLV